MATLDIAAVARDSGWLAHRYDETKDVVHMLRLDRDGHRSVTFITDDYIGADAARLVLRRGDLMVAAAPPAPMQFISISICCSPPGPRLDTTEGGGSRPLISTS